MRPRIDPEWPATLQMARHLDITREGVVVARSHLTRLEDRLLRALVSYAYAGAEDEGDICETLADDGWSDDDLRALRGLLEEERAERAET